jgi:hypothetical protein
MRATTGRFSLSTTGRALMLLKVSDANAIGCVSSSPQRFRTVGCCKLTGQ